MENDIISLFLNRKKQNISRYTEIFVKYTLKGNVKLNRIINKIVEIYIDNYYLERNLDFSLLMKYFEIKKTQESLMKDVLLSSILFYKNSGLEKQIDSDIKTIVILSNLIFLALNLDEYVNEFKNADIDLESQINTFLDKFKTKIKIQEDLNSLSEELLKDIKKDRMAEKKFWKNLIDNNYILNFSRTLKNTNYYFVTYYYDIKMLKRYDDDEVQRTSFTKGIMDDIITIYLEKLSVYILKLLLLKHNNDYFFINIYSDYFNKNKNLINIERIFSNKSIKKRLVFCFDYNKLKGDMNVIKYLHEKNYKLGLTNICSDAVIESKSFDLFDYVFISSDIMEKYKEFEEIWSIKKINFVIDNETFIPIDDKTLLKECR